MLRMMRFPMRRAGGPFLICIGAGMIVGVALRGNHVVNLAAFLSGVLPGLGVLLLSSRLSAVTPAPSQVRALLAAIALEVVLFVALGAFVDPAIAPRAWWLYACLIVGIHFFPMMVSFGLPMGVLGGLCSAYATLGLLAPGIDFAPLGLLDGLTKVVVGTWMFKAANQPGLRVPC